MEDEPEAHDPPTHDERVQATLAHVGGFLSSFLLPLVLWLTQKDRDSFAARHAREALNFQIAQFFYAGFMSLLSGIAFLVFYLSADAPTGAIAMIVTIVIATCLFLLYEVVLIFLAASAAWNGRPFRYPLNIRLV